jgi:hypothetical protein
MKKMTLCSDCVEVQKILDIDIERLIQELGIQKGDNLSDQEQRYLCLSLLGNEPKDIAKLDYYDRCRYDLQRNHPNLTAEELETAVKKELAKKAEQNIRPYLSKTINDYVKNLMGVPEKTPMPSWSKVMYFLKQNGYTMIDLSGESKKTTFKIRLGGQPSDSAIVELLRRFNNPNLSVVFQELKGDEQND